MSILGLYSLHDATVGDLEEVHTFSAEHATPQWRFCKGVPPYPSVDMMAKNLERNDVFVIVRRDSDNQIMGYRICDRWSGRPLWGLAHRDHADGDDSHMLEVFAHITARVWAHIGGPSNDVTVPAVSDENVADSVNRTLERSLEIYETLAT